jgi:Leucine-rich repeat (LRR) protein
LVQDQTLNRNLLASWVPTFTNAANIDLSNRNIATADSRTFSSLSFLTCLSLARNRLKSLDSYLFNDLINLKSLNLNVNSLSSLNPYTFSTLKNLVSLHLSHNQLTNIDATMTFVSQINLRNLNLDHNRLTKIEENTFSFLSKIVNIDLKANNIVSIHRLTFLGLTNLEVVYLGSNPISLTQTGFVNQLCLTNPRCIICLFDSCDLKNKISLI